MRKKIDDLAVAGADHHNGDDCQHTDEYSQVGMPLKVAHDLLRAVAGRRERVASQAHPCKECDQGDFMKDRFIRDVAGIPDNGVF